MVTCGPLKNPGIGNGHLWPPAEQKAPVPAGFLWHRPVSFTTLTRLSFCPSIPPWNPLLLLEKYPSTSILFNSHPFFFLSFSSPAAILFWSTVHSARSLYTLTVQRSKLLLFHIGICSTISGCSAMKFCGVIITRLQARPSVYQRAPDVSIIQW